MNLNRSSIICVYDTVIPQYAANSYLCVGHSAGTDTGDRNVVPVVFSLDGDSKVGKVVVLMWLSLWNGSDELFHPLSICPSGGNLLLQKYIPNLFVCNAHTWHFLPL